MAQTLSIVLGRHGQVQDLRDGSVRVDGFELAFSDVARMPEAYRAMARTQPYDVCEMAPTSYLMARAAGAPLVALPIPMTRRFRHAGLLRRADSPVRGPKDIEGRQVGLRTYSVTAAVWTRGIYADEFGVDPGRVRWLTAEEENVAGAPLPVNVHRIAPGQSLAAMLAAGELELAFAGLAGAGDGDGPELVDVVEDAERQERAWFARTGIYPLHGVIVVRRDVLERHPGLPQALAEAFDQAKRGYLARVESGEADSGEDRRYWRLAEWVGDPLPYGLEENAPALQALVRYAHAQGLIPAVPDLREVFLDLRAADAHAAARPLTGAMQR